MMQARLLSAGMFLLRFAGTCAVFYVFFRCRMIGAGDVKLMGLVTGFLGVWNGILVLCLGLLLAAGTAAYRMKKQGTLWTRLERLSQFIIQMGIKGRLMEYPGYFEKESLLRLGPYLFAGYCLFLLIR